MGAGAFALSSRSHVRAHPSRVEIPSPVEEISRKAVPCRIEHEFPWQLRGFSCDPEWLLNSRVRDVSGLCSYALDAKTHSVLAFFARRRNASRTRSLKGTQRVDFLVFPSLTKIRDLFQRMSSQRSEMISPTKPSPHDHGGERHGQPCAGNRLSMQGLSRVVG